MTMKQEASKTSSARKEKRQHIGKAAFQCFSKGGYHNTTVDEICTQAGISKGSFYWHYTGKQACFLDVLYAWADAVETQLEEQFRDAVETRQAHGVAEALQREIRRQRAVLPIWIDLLAEVRREEEIQPGLATFHRRIRATVAELLHPLMSPIFSDEEIHSTAATIVGAFLGLSLQDLADPQGAPFESNIRNFMQVFATLAKSLDELTTDEE
jgi:AcrR family transcriptional regulator